MRTRGLAVAALVVWAFSGFAWAEEGDMRVQFGFLYTTPTDDLKDDGQTLELDESFGVQVSFEYMVTDLIGIEPALGSAGTDVEVEEPGFPDLKLGEIDFVALTANVNFHLLRDGSVDLFVGPTVGYTFWGDLDSDLFGQDFPADDEFVFGFNVGVDVPVGESGWGFSGSIRYLSSDVSLEGGAGVQDLGVNPVEINLGASFRF